MLLNNCDETKGDGRPVNVTSMRGVFGTYQSDLGNNYELKLCGFIKERGQLLSSGTYGEKFCHLWIKAGKKKTVGVFLCQVPDFCLSSSADFAALPICCRINRSGNFAVGCCGLSRRE